MGSTNAVKFQSAQFFPHQNPIRASLANVARRKDSDKKASENRQVTPIKDFKGSEQADFVKTFSEIKKELTSGMAVDPTELIERMQEASQSYRESRAGANFKKQQTQHLVTKYSLPNGLKSYRKTQNNFHHDKAGE